MRRAYKFRIFPKKSQATLINSQMGECRWLYNTLLAFKISEYKDFKRNFSKFALIKKITELKNSRESLKSVNAQVLQQVAIRLDKAFADFFRRMKSGETPGFPRFKSFGQITSLVYPQRGFSINVETKILKISKIGEVKVNLHRPIIGVIKTFTVTKSPTGRYYVVFSVEAENSAPLQKTGKIVGCDLGSRTLVTLSDGSTFANPKFSKSAWKNLSKHQRKSANAKNKKDWTVFRREKKIVTRLHEKVVNKRDDFQHKTANALLKNYDVIALEKLDISAMQKTPLKSLNRSISDAAWSTLTSKLVYKAANAGKLVVFVDPCNTSKTCSNCQKLHVNFSLSDKVMNCECGYSANRDLNAAKNILRLGTTLGLQSLQAVNESLPLFRSPRIYSGE